MLSLVPAKAPLFPGVNKVVDWFSTVAADRNVIPSINVNTTTEGKSTRAMSWCPVSKTKIVLLSTVIYTANGGGTSFLARVVNFVDKKPVYSNYSTLFSKPVVFDHPMMRMVKISEDRFVFVTPESLPKNGMAAQHIYHLVKLNADDSFTVISKTAAITTASTSRDLVPQLPMLISAGDGRAWFAGSSVGSQSSSSTLAYPMIYLIKMTGDTLTVEASRGFSTNMSGYLYPYYSGHRKDRKGVDWATISAAVTFIWNSFEPSSSSDGRTGLSASSDNYNYRNLVPIEGDKFLYFASNVAYISQFRRNTGNGGNNYITGITNLLTESGKEIQFNQIHVEDVVWVNSYTFLMIAGVGAPQGPISSNVINTPDVANTMSTDLQLIVCKYDDATNKVTIASSTNMLDLSISKRTYDSMLHIVDEGTVAAIGTFAPKGTANTQHQILMLKPT